MRCTSPSHGPPRGSRDWLLVREFFGWRQFRNRREVAGCLGLTPTPYASGTIEVELDIGKAGDRRCRWLMVELAWSWLRLQPDSRLSHWFNQRYAGTSRRLRRIGIGSTRPEHPRAAHCGWPFI
nr:transposase [Paraburkholderia sp. PGU19]